jgi:hypothetical protein
MLTGILVELLGESNVASDEKLSSLAFGVLDDCVGLACNVKDMLRGPTRDCGTRTAVGTEADTWLLVEAVVEEVSTEGTPCLGVIFLELIGEASSGMLMDVDAEAKVCSSIVLMDGLRRCITSVLESRWITRGSALPG